MQTLASPPSPTSAPLRSAAITLRGVLSDLRARCAPLRDAEIDSMLDTLSPEASAEELPRAVAMAFKGILELAEKMQDDLRHYALDALPRAPESELQAVLRAHARVREREVVKLIWGGAEMVRKSWQDWIRGVSEGDTPRERWRKGLIDALGMPISISFGFPSQTVPNGTFSATPNVLPAPFLVPFPALFHLQNLVEALVICASVRSLVPASPTPTSPSPSPSASSPPSPRTLLTQRVWILLRSEIGNTGRGNSPTGAGESETKIAHLEEEVLQAWKLAKNPHPNSNSNSDSDLDVVTVPVPVSVSEAQENALRAAVRRVLRAEDPVFKLLLARVRAFLYQAPTISSPSSSSASDGGGETTGPKYMRTGFARFGNGQSFSPPQSSPNAKDVTVTHLASLPSVRGFEEDILREGLKEVRDSLDTIVEWTEWVWDDIIE